MPSRKVLLLSLAVTLAVVAWGYLVLSAIDFGASARGGESRAWIFLGVSCLGAAACLFAGLMLGARMLRELGIMTEPAAAEPEPDEPEPAPDSLAGMSPTPRLTVSPVVEETAVLTAVPTTTEAPARAPERAPEPATMTHISETLRPEEPATQSWTLSPKPDPLSDPLTGPIAELPRASQYRPWQPVQYDEPARPAEPTEPTAGPGNAGPEVPAPRDGDKPRGKRVADQPLHPDGPRPTGGRRIAR